MIMMITMMIMMTMMRIINDNDKDNIDEGYYNK